MSTWDTPRTRPVKEALRDLLGDGRWHDHQEVISTMLRAGDLNLRTCTNMLRELTKDWSLATKGSYRPGGQHATDTRAYRAQSRESLRPTRDIVASIDRDLKKAHNRRNHLNEILRRTVAQIAELTEEISDMEEMREVMLNLDEEDEE